MTELTACHARISAAAAIVPSDAIFAAAAERLLDATEAADLGGIRHAGRRRQWLAGRLLARRVLDGCLRLDDDLPLLRCDELLSTRSAWRIGRAPDGAPLALRSGSEAFLSLSHSGDIALAAAAPDRRVGVDVEEVASPIRGLIAAPAEGAWIDSAGDDPRGFAAASRFSVESALATLLWCAKETVLKTGGFGAISPGRAMTLALLPGVPARTVADMWMDARGWRPLPVHLPDFAVGLVLAWRPIGQRHVGVIASLPPSHKADELRRSRSEGVRPMLADATIAAVRRNAPVLDRVKRVFVDVVRYPASAFDGIHDDLENDLGIDSVKLGEVLVALRAEFRLAQDDILPERIAPDGVRSLAGITGTIEDALRGRAPDPQDIAPPPLAAVTPPAPLPERHVPAAAAPSAVQAAPTLPISTPRIAATDVLAIVTRAFADVTRYPTDILQPEADLEDDLGIDSVKFGEIMSTLRERLRVPPAEDWPNTFPRTIGDVARIVSLPEARDAVTAAPAAPAKRAPAAPRPTVGRFDGKVALVTGSGHGVGRSHALRLAELGAEVVVNSFHSREAGDHATAEIRANGGKAHHVWGSVANPAHVERLYAEVETTCGGLDFLVNSASHTVLKPFDEITADDMLKLYATNVVAVQLGSLAAAKLMVKRGGGRIVNLSATASRHVSHLYAAMAPVHAALETLTRYLAVELMAANVQVNCLSVSFGARELAARWPGKSPRLPSWEATLPDEQPCTADELAEMVVFLLDARTRQLNGSVISLDGASATALAGAAR